MALTEADRLRQLLGETIPVGGTDADTMFTVPQVEDFLAQGGGDIETAAYYGWRAKWAELSNLANTATGATRDELGNLSKTAKEHMDYYGGLAGIVSAPATRTRIGRIVR